MREKMYTFSKIITAAFCLFLFFSVKNVSAADDAPYDFHVNYDCNGGYWYQDNNGNPDSFSPADSDQATYKLAAPIREGYHFVRWVPASEFNRDTFIAVRVEDETDAEGTVTGSILTVRDLSEDDPAEAKILQEQFEDLHNRSGNNCYTLTAQWEKESYTVSFDYRDGRPLEEKSVLYQDCVQEPADPEREGFSFDGWYTDNTLENDTYDFHDGVTESMTLYAGWRADYYLRIYNQDNPGGDICCGFVDVEIASHKEEDYQKGEINIAFSVMEESAVKITAKAAPGFLFAGWYEGKEPPANWSAEDKNKVYTTTADQSRYLCAVFQCITIDTGNTGGTGGTGTGGTGTGGTGTGGTGTGGTGTGGNGTAGSNIKQAGTNAKAANPLKIKAKKVTVKYNKLRAKTQKIKIKKAVKYINKGAGTKTYKKIKGNKKIKINKKTGKITIKKGLKRGTYKVKIQIRAAGNKSYKAVTKRVTVKIKVV